MNKDCIFISHSSKDDTFVRALRNNLETRGFATWVDSRELIAGAELEPVIKQEIEKARAFAVVLSSHAFNSPWILKEVRYALEVKQNKEQPGDFPVIPLMLEGIEPGALNLYFENEPLGIKGQSGPGGITEAMPQILAALGERLPDDVQPMISPAACLFKSLNRETQGHPGRFPR